MRPRWIDANPPDAISENIYAGNAMTRRMFYQYGVLLPASPFGHAGQGLQMNTAAGTLGLIPPTRVGEDDNLDQVIDVAITTEHPVVVTGTSGEDVGIITKSRLLQGIQGGK